MALPDPVPGLAVSDAYLWRNEAKSGPEEGRKDRPCAIVLAVRDDGGRTVVTVAPITHAPPERPDIAVVRLSAALCAKARAFQRTSTRRRGRGAEDAEAAESERELLIARDARLSSLRVLRAFSAPSALRAFSFPTRVLAFR